MVKLALYCAFVQGEAKAAAEAGKPSWKSKPMRHKVEWGKTLPTTVRQLVPVQGSRSCCIIFSCGIEVLALKTHEHAFLNF